MAINNICESGEKKGGEKNADLSPLLCGNQ